jgi:hypothetical protein
MNTLSKLAATAALVAVFAGASAGEPTVDEIVVIGKRPVQVLPQIEPLVMPDLVIDIEPIKPVPVIEIARVGDEARQTETTGS